MGSSPQVEATNEDSGMTVLDLPELTLECILERLPPSGLCSMAGVCSSLRERCVSNHLWEKHMKQKWGGLMGPAAHREWQWYLACRDSANLRQGKQRGLTRLLSIVWPFWWVGSRVVDSTTYSKQTSYLPVDSIMSWYLALETGKFWFPAQVYNRENGHVGFMLSCYDAELSYDPRTDTFQARDPFFESYLSISWTTSCAILNWSPIQIIVNTVALEFNHYTPGSRWRRTTISRKEHREEGNEADGFYGGIRKLKSNEEISIWRRLWPVQVLE
ncbi:hypothetical protein HS088_TW22G01281 [Tripterygium wilfordii]|uniref:F-box domain-containing protein n=1 Tax=Tripterygium wilfordii TaxID=458696 RepID=A0A7J7C0W7_TRIWF|nr:hypothetical protein HS088_TW22G01281 [Tripterygium wilfordii]